MINTSNASINSSAESSNASIRPKPSVTPFLRMDADNGWRQAELTQGIIEDHNDHSLRLGKRGDFAIATNEPFGSFGGMTLPTGVTVSDYGHVLLADPEHDCILYYDTLTAKKTENIKNTDENKKQESYPFTPLWQAPSKQRNQIQDTATNQENITPLTTSDDEHLTLLNSDYSEEKSLSSPYQLKQPNDVAFSHHGEIAVADTGHGRVVIYCWPGLQVRSVLNIPNSEPKALAYDQKNRLHIADAGNGKIWRITPFFNIDYSYNSGEALLSQPSALAFDDNNTLFVLDKNNARLFIKPTTQTEKEAWQELDILDSDIFNRTFLVPPFSYGPLSKKPHEKEILSYPQRKAPNCERLILSNIELNKQGLLVNTSLPLMTRPRTIRLPRSGTFFSQQFDSQITDSQWHRLVLDTHIPETSRLVIETYTSDRIIEDSELTNLTWSTPFVISTDANNARPELLIQSDAGRYLRIKIDFLGDGFSTPSINSIQLFGPRQSALQYLPPPFHQDPESVYFLDRFLSYFDTVQDEIRFMMRDFTRYLDPYGVPAGPFLEWLGSWFNWQFYAQWSPELRREIIAKSIEFFKTRGTVKGIKQILQWHTGLSGEQPQIIEHFRLARLFNTHSNDNSKEHCPLFLAEKPLLPEQQKITHWFTVVLPSHVIENEEQHAQISSLIEAQKPAHTAFQLCIFNPGVRIARQSTIGVDTWLGHYPEAPLGDMHLGQSSTLSNPTSNGGGKGIKIGQQLLN